MAQHIDRLRHLFICLPRFSVAINFDKWVFAQTDVQFLGHLFSKDAIRKLPELLELKWPEIVMDLSKFLGMANFNRRLIMIFEKAIKNVINLWLNGMTNRWRLSMIANGHLPMSQCTLIRLQCLNYRWWLMRRPSMSLVQSANKWMILFGNLWPIFQNSYLTVSEYTARMTVNCQ